MRLLTILLWLWAGAAGAAVVEVDLDDDTPVPVETFDAPGQHLVLWIPSEYGNPPSVRDVADGLAQRGLGVWVADLLTAYFQPTTPSGLDAVPPEAVAALITRAAEQTGKTVFLATNDRGAALALAGARLWRQRHPESEVLGGLVLISPYLLVGTPDVGTRGEYLPLVHSAPGPIFILQPTLSPGRWQLPELLQALTEGGTDVFTQPLIGVRDRFFFRPDAEAGEADLAQQLPRDVGRAIALLAKTRRPPGRIAAVGDAQPAVPQPQRTRGLSPYRANPDPPSLALDDLQGEVHSLGQYRGKVVLLNFWASWCPPCVHEMPSMQQLKAHYDGQPLAILAVNMGESKETIEAFLPRVNTDFPILLDGDGSALKTWKVFAFPTSYVIDRNGKIRYALYGAVDWMEQENLEVFDRLLAEPGDRDP